MSWDCSLLETASKCLWNPKNARKIARSKRKTSEHDNYKGYIFISFCWNCKSSGHQAWYSSDKTPPPSPFFSWLQRRAWCMTRQKLVHDTWNQTNKTETGIVKLWVNRDRNHPLLVPFRIFFTFPSQSYRCFSVLSRTIIIISNLHQKLLHQALKSINKFISIYFLKCLLEKKQNEYWH